MVGMTSCLEASSEQRSIWSWYSRACIEARKNFRPRLGYRSFSATIYLTSCSHWRERHDNIKPWTYWLGGEACTELTKTSYSSRRYRSPDYLPRSTAPYYPPVAYGKKRNPAFKMIRSKKKYKLALNLLPYQIPCPDTYNVLIDN